MPASGLDGWMASLNAATTRPASVPVHTVVATEPSILFILGVPVGAAIVGALLTILGEQIFRRRSEIEARNRLRRAVARELAQIVAMCNERATSQGNVMLMPPLPAGAWRAFSASRHIDSLRENQLQGLVDTYASVESANYQGGQVPRFTQISALSPNAVVSREFRAVAIRLSTLPYAGVITLAQQSIAVLGGASSSERDASGVGGNK